MGKSTGTRAILADLVSQHPVYRDTLPESASRALETEADLAREIRRLLGPRVRAGWQQAAIEHAVTVEAFVETWRRFVRGRPDEWADIAEDYGAHKAQLAHERRELLTMLRGGAASATASPPKAAPGRGVAAPGRAGQAAGPAGPAVPENLVDREDPAGPDDPDDAPAGPFGPFGLFGGDRRRVLGLAGVAALAALVLIGGVIAATSGGTGHPAAASQSHISSPGPSSTQDAPTPAATSAATSASSSPSSSRTPSKSPTTPSPTPTGGPTSPSATPTTKLTKILTINVSVAVDAKGQATATIHITTTDTNLAHVNITWAGSNTANAAGTVGTQVIGYHLLAGATTYDFVKHATAKDFCPAGFLGVTVKDDGGPLSFYGSVKSAC